MESRKGGRVKQGKRSALSSTECTQRSSENLIPSGKPGLAKKPLLLLLLLLGALAVAYLEVGTPPMPIKALTDVPSVAQVVVPLMTADLAVPQAPWIDQVLALHALVLERLAPDPAFVQVAAQLAGIDLLKAVVLELVLQVLVLEALKPEQILLAVERKMMKFLEVPRKFFARKQ
ncbi:hypothetical protein Taro_038565 [Colocasia esculenta]|uniref:Uncharacterized protein n=1 Tax=Colocasia esculenta TaxID=4460 RepID=A0A843W8I0_COLES|nr:hypothetical protein [Colocasia esculenta]